MGDCPTNRARHGARPRHVSANRAQCPTSMRLLGATRGEIDIRIGALVVMHSPIQLRLKLVGCRVQLQVARKDEPEDLLPAGQKLGACLLYTSPSPRDRTRSR